MKKIIPKLKDILETIPILDDNRLTTFTIINVDDIFTALKTKGVNELRVNWYEMLTIAKFVIANITCIPKEDYNWKSLEILKTGKIDEFLGVKLYLDE